MQPAKIPVVYILLLFKLWEVWIRNQGLDLMQKRLSFFLIHSLLSFLKQKVTTVGARVIYHRHLITSGNKGGKPNDAEKQIALNILQRER